ncbi:MAG TPA: TIGR03435 family protein, partial [Candidatus Acidoferrum sp.]|nr:TIGR03435 family protein [Candidatus Acidoferrum sp.]
MKRVVAGISFLALFCIAVFGQSPATPVAFDVVDIHASAPSQFPFFQEGVLRGDRYILRDATLVDLIATAYGVPNEKVVGGPSWLDTDHFDVIAKAPPTTTPETIKLMLQSMLADRFKLVLHNDTKAMPVFVLTVGKGKVKMKEATGGEANSGCAPQAPPQNSTPGTIQNAVVSCHNVSMDTFAQNIRQFAGGYLSNPVVNSTDLKGTWDFDITWTGRGQLAAAGSEGISIFDAVDKQLGLKLEAQKLPLPVLVVDSANEKPTDNPASVAKALPPPPPAEFEVAIIKPSGPGETPNGAINGGQINLQFTTLKQLIAIAWDLNPLNNDMIVNAPKWLDSDHFDITAKVTTDAPPPGGASPNALPADIE